MHEDPEHADQEHLQTARGDKGNVQQQQPTAHRQEQGAGTCADLPADRWRALLFLSRSGSCDRRAWRSDPSLMA